MMRKTAIVMALLLGFGPSAGHSSPLVDQQQTELNATGGFQTGEHDIAQTFTVGITGQLDSISIIAASGGPPMALNLLLTSGGLPTSLILASATIAGTKAGPPLWTTFDFSSSNVIVTFGEVLAFEPIETGSFGQAVGEEFTGTGDGSVPVGPDPYSGGAMFYRQFPCPGMSCPPPTEGAWVPVPMLNPGGFKDADMTFMTVVSPTPLPAALPLFATGLGVIGLLSWRRKRKDTAAVN